jgi:hypothetical protein
MTNPRFLQTAERWMNHELPTERTQRVKTPNVSGTNMRYSDLPKENFPFSYDGLHGQFFQELIAKSNEKFKGTRAEIPTGSSGEVKNMYATKRMALVSTIATNSNLRSYGLFPITPMQDESLLKENRLGNPRDYWEDLALLLYDTSSKGYNPNESVTLREEIINHRTDLGLSQSDLEERLVVVNAGGEPDSRMKFGVRPVVIPGITIAYPHEVLSQTGKNHLFNYGLDRGLPSVSELGNGKRTLYMPSEKTDIGLRVLYRDRDLYLGAGIEDLADDGGFGRVNFAPQAQTP